MDGHANEGRNERLAALSRPIPQLEHYLSLNGTGRHHLSRRGQTRSRITPFASTPLSFGIQSNIRRYLCNDGRSDDDGRGRGRRVAATLARLEVPAAATLLPPSLSYSRRFKLKHTP